MLRFAPGPAASNVPAAVVVAKTDVRKAHRRSSDICGRESLEVDEPCDLDVEITWKKKLQGAPAATWAFDCYSLQYSTAQRPTGERNGLPNAC